MAEDFCMQDGARIPYRRLKPLATRIEEARELQSSSQERVPIIIERAANEKFLPLMTRVKFLIPKTTALSQLHFSIRKRLQLHEDQSYFLLVNGRHMPTFTTSIHTIYNEHKADDGFLYMTYASQEVFG